MSIFFSRYPEFRSYSYLALFIAIAPSTYLTATNILVLREKYMRNLITTAEVWKEGGRSTSYCPELDIASYGHTPEEAKKNLQEVITIHLEETAKMGTLDAFLNESGYVQEGNIVTTNKKIVCFEEISIPIPVV